MRTIRINDYVIFDAHTGKRRWLTNLPRRLRAQEYAVRVTGTISYPEPLQTIDIGEVTFEEVEVNAEARME